MSQHDEWSPDEPQGTETFEQSDEAFDEEARLDPGFVDQVGGDPSTDPANVLDELELEEAGLELDNPEAMVTLEGGGDDPDGSEDLSRTRERERAAPSEHDAEELDSESEEDD